MTERVQQDRDEFAKAKRDTWNTTDYGSWFKPARGQVIDTLEKAALKKALEGRNYERALDVGIGNGRLLPIYSPHAKHITGMDISSEQLDQATQAARDLGLNFDTKLCQEASKIDIPDNSYDLIICSRVLQHVYDWRESVAEFARILKPGGDLVLLTYNRASVYGLKKYYQHKFQNPTKGRFQNPAGLTKHLKKNGLVIDYFEGALMGQPDLFSKDLSTASREFINSLEKLGSVPLIKYLGSRLVIRARKL
ncbi:MAG TPA: class I SAM-dependent methyltransferase [Pyrinomonadaceae bacterium]|jgi:ubiquinone/menaquinone biosynthesis C-methylase UbiE|nr:class I SAM-dependent methyltransferase [Pyrinomonadaceae bacterium]